MKIHRFNLIEGGETIIDLSRFVNASKLSSDKFTTIWIETRNGNISHRVTQTIDEIKSLLDSDKLGFDEIKSFLDGSKLG